MGLALNKLGYSLNDTNPSHLKEAEKDLNHLHHKFVALLETKSQ